MFSKSNAGCDIVLAHSTYPLRTAKNSDQIISDVKDATGIDICVIDGATEARYSFLGATSGLHHETPCVIDIGGGSTELSIGKEKSLLYRKSIPIGAVNLTERFITSYPINDGEFSALDRHIELTLKQGFSIDLNISVGIAIAGTPTTLACMKLGLTEFDEEKIDKSVLTLGEMNYFIAELSKLHPDEILKRYGFVVKGREDVLLTGTLILTKIMNFLQLGSIVVSSNGLRHGAVIEYLFKTSGKYFE
jgi:exopolyphosphatase / guanosine-5'-triphosphate,3'-diphosphate pyrophosphatase